MQYEKIKRAKLQIQQQDYLIRRSRLIPPVCSGGRKYNLSRHYSINFDTWLQLLFKILAIAFERFWIRLQLAERH